MSKEYKELFTTYIGENKPQPNDGPHSPPWRGEGDGAPPGPINPRPENTLEMFGNDIVWLLTFVGVVLVIFIFMSQKKQSVSV